jgi:hypothetical protein
MPRATGSRFLYLEEEEASGDEARELVEEVAWLGLGMEPEVQPIGRSPELTQEEVEADFWEKIGFPTSESR